MKPDDGYVCYIVNPKSGASSSKLVVPEIPRRQRLFGKAQPDYFPAARL
jgi:hypothetical protein